MPFAPLLLLILVGGWALRLGGRNVSGSNCLRSISCNLFLQECGGFRGGYSEALLTARARVAQDDKVNSVVIEPNFGDGIFNAPLKPVLKKIGYPVAVIDAKRFPAQKERRISDCLEPFLNQHKLVVNKARVVEDYESTENLPAEELNRDSLYYQLTRITKDKGALVKDGWTDAVAPGVHSWTEQVATKGTAPRAQSWGGSIKRIPEQGTLITAYQETQRQRIIPMSVTREIDQSPKWFGRNLRAG